MKDTISDEFKEVKDDVEDYVNARLDLIKIHAAENLSKFFSGLMINMVVFYISMFVLLFTSMAIAVWLDRVFESSGIGYLIVAFFYFLCGIVFFLLRSVLVEKPVIKSFIKLFFPSFTDYNNENEKQ